MEIFCQPILSRIANVVYFKDIRKCPRKSRADFQRFLIGQNLKIERG